MPQIAWLIKARNLFLIDHEAENPSLGGQHGQVLGGLPFWWQTADFSLHLHVAEGARELQPHDPITSQRLHLLRPSHSGLGLQLANLEGHKYSVYCTMPSIRKIQSPATLLSTVAKRAFSSWAPEFGSDQFQFLNLKGSYLSISK